MRRASKRDQREPSALALREMPALTEEDWKNARPNPYAARIAKEAARQHAKPGRPRKGSAPAPTETVTLRLTAELRKIVEKRAHEEGITLHAALRQAVLAWVKAA